MIKALRSRLLVALGVSSVAASELAGCGGDSESNDMASGGAAGFAGAATAGGGSAPVGGPGGASGSSAGGASGAAGASGSAGSGGSAGSSGAAAGGSAGGGAGGIAGATAGGGSGGIITIRRPFLVGASLRSARAESRDDWVANLARAATPQLDSRTLTLLQEVWLRDALEEHASVAAFARFTMMLLSVGAPSWLVTASQRASLDEIEHARACFALARRYGSICAGPSVLPVADSLTATSLAEIVALTVTEGCVGETLGALLATEQLAVSSDPVVARVLKKIAVDEARHAEIAWRFVQWAMTKGGKSVASFVEDALARAVSEVESMVIRDYGVDIATWHAHGRLTCEEARRLSRRGLAEVILPCARALLDSKQASARRGEAVLTSHVS